MSLRARNTRAALTAVLALGGLLTAFSFSPRAALAWGGDGHADVAHVAVASLPEPLRAFYAQNGAWFEKNSSFPDRWRNRPDRAEAPRHFLDTENFGVGTDLSKIPHDFAGAEKVRTYDQLRTDGTNPWTVRRHYQLLVSAFKEKRWEDAMVQSAFLSHYVGDAHVPFHASANYDGQLSEPPQKGIHSRFESVMVEKTIKPGELKPGAPEKVGDPVDATFAALQESIDQVPAILAADRDAAKAAGINLAKAGRGDFTDVYWTAFAEKTRPIAVARLEKGGRTLAGFLVKAWEEAGKPAPPATFAMTDRLLPYAPEFVERGQTPPPVPPPVTDAAKQAARARAVNISIPSKALGKDVPATVLLPKDYETSGLRYSVLYLLHGASGNSADWVAKSGIAAYTADLPLIVVMPDALGNSFYIDSPGFGKVGEFYNRELLPAIDAKYRTVARAEGRAIAGLSMGGYGAWRIALDSPDKYAAVASLSGVLSTGENDIDPKNPFVAALLGTADPSTLPKMAEGARLWPRIEKLSDGKGAWRGPALYFDCGSDDMLVEDSRKMEARLLERAVPYEFAEFPGQHDWTYWDEHVRDVLLFVQRHVSAPGK
jgi:S-formylglutathione hydrolase FrmB